MNNSPKTTVLNAEGIVTSLLPPEAIKDMMTLADKEGARVCIINHIGVWEESLGPRWDAFSTYKVVYEEPESTFHDSLITW